MIELIIISLSNIFWALYCLCDGTRLGMLKVYEKNSRREIVIDYKKIYKIQAILFVVIMSFVTFYLISYYSIPLIISQLLLYKYLTSKSYDCAIKNIKYFTLESHSEKYKNNMIVGVIIQIILIIFIFL